MKNSTAIIDGYDTSHLKRAQDGFVDYDYYQTRGRRLQARVLGDLFQQAGRFLARDYLKGFRR